jgi:hypothetical protein
MTNTDNHTECRYPSCSETLYEMALCNEHFHAYIDWKRREGYGSTPRVEQWLTYEQMCEEAGYPHGMYNVWMPSESLVLMLLGR